MARDKRDPIRPPAAHRDERADARTAEALRRLTSRVARLEETTGVGGGGGGGCGDQVDVEDDQSTVTADASALSAGIGLSATDDGDGTATIDAETTFSTPTLETTYTPSNFDFSDAFPSIAVNGTDIFLAAEDTTTGDDDSLVAIDASSPASPSETDRLTNVTNGQSIRGMTVDAANNDLYFTGASAGVIDISDTSNLSTTGTLDRFGNNCVQSGNFLYVAAGNWLEVLDFSTQSSPSLSKKMGADPYSNPITITINDAATRLYVGTDQFPFYTIHDIDSDGSDPRAIGVTDGVPNPIKTNWRVARSSSLVVCTDQPNDQLYIMTP